MNGLLQSCERPVRIKDKVKGGYMFVPCGHCDSCRRKYQLAWRERLEAESRNSVSVLFFTLTYDNEHVPIATLSSDGKFLSVNRKSIDNIYFDEFDFDVDINQFPQLCINHNSNEYVKNSFPVVCREDIQLFIKRLRRRLEYDSHSLLSDLSDDDKTFRYFVCAEYGPNTFRPHYHGLLFFKSKRTSKAVAERYIYESWQLCDRRNLDCQEVFSCASSYVSKYVVADTRLPLILQVPALATFSLRSSRPAIGACILSFDELFDKVKQHSLVVNKVTVDTDGVACNVSVPISSRVINRYFVPLYKESIFTRDDLLQFYSSYLKFVSDYELTKWSDLSYRALSEFLPNRIKQVDSYVDALRVDYPNSTLSDVYKHLTYEEICFGIRQNRSSLIHYILNHILDGKSLIDYVDTRLDLKTVRFSMLYASFVDSFNHSSISHHPFDVLYWSYPSLFADLPRYLPSLTRSEYVSLHLRFFSIGYDLSEFYDSSGLLIDYHIPKYNTTSEYVSYISSIRDSVIKFNKSRKLAQAEALKTNIYSPI